MTPHANRILILLSIFQLCMQITCIQSPKVNARPVHEFINEQSRNDDKLRITSSPGILPYGNPLAGNSQQNARIHAKNQQAMFNAERIRQHRAQLQRWTKAPIKMDSYMKAYQESQESHQLALEQQQTSQNDKVVTAPPKGRQRLNNNYRVNKNLKDTEPTKITRADAVTNTESVRVHRSYGTVGYKQYLHPHKHFNTVLVTPGPTYDQGVTIKPNGNVGLTNVHQQNDPKLLTEAISSFTKYLYPKHFHEMKTSKDIDMLNALLNKKPLDQLTELTSLLYPSKSTTQKPVVDELNTPIDLYFYLNKDHPSPSPQNYGNIKHNQVQAYTLDPVTVPKDHKPIVEEVDDIEDPNKVHKVVNFGFQSIPAENPATETTSYKSNNYYKVEAATQNIKTGFKPLFPAKQQDNYLNNKGESPYSLHYEKPLNHLDPNTEGDLSERYLHHNARHVGIKHLTGDGTGVSAYGDENLHYAANYEFGYHVRDIRSGNNFGHSEATTGGKTNGQYHVLLPDGRMQQVKYSAGPEGYHADISYDHLQ